MKLNVIYLEIVRFEPLNSLNDRIAVIGFGPAGSTITLILAKKGYKETIFESEEKIGWMLRYGIPEFRIPKDILDKFEKNLLN